MELVDLLVRALASSETIRGITCEVTVAAAVERVLELCPEALGAVVDGEEITVEASRQRVSAIGSYTLKSSRPTRFKLTIQLAEHGAATRVTLSSRADWLGELDSTDRRRNALLDVGYWLRDHAGAVAAG